MANRYSVADARDRLAKLVHDAERGAAVEITRRGKPVAVLVSLSEYQRLRKGANGFWHAFQKFLKEVDTGKAAIEPVSRRRCNNRRIHDVLTPNRLAICPRVPSRASHASTTRSRRSIEYGLMPWSPASLQEDYRHDDMLHNTRVCSSG